ncbi:MAG: DUF1015 domain-containing protein [Gemmatimonadetes bacterium]|nr:DUF1015 domain-containing protein [Gemmatimonadota bacterium]
MPDLHPFPALRFSRHAGSLSKLLAPPYDVITVADAERLRARHRGNAVRLVLPEGDAPEKYEQAATLLEQWREEGLLELDPVPSVTVYRQDFRGPDGPVSRHGLFAALTLSPLDQGEVLPHERTHSGPKRDRLALTMATRTQLSPVFLTARDENARLFDGLLAATAAAPDDHAVTPDGVSHTTWRIDASELARSLCEAAGAGPLLIADGHHRYETALEAYRQLGDGTPAARRVLACVVSERDPGLRIQPTHRTVVGAPVQDSPDDWVAALSGSFELRPVADPSPVSAARHAEDHDLIVLWSNGQAWEIRPTAGAVSASGLDEADASIPSVVLNHLVIEGILGQNADTAARDGRLVYLRDAEEAVLAAGGDGAAFLLPAVQQEAVWRVTSVGRRLPPKSTYYEPKIPSGLLFRPLDAGN